MKPPIRCSSPTLWWEAPRWCIRGKEKKHLNRMYRKHTYNTYMNFCDISIRDCLSLQIQIWIFSISGIWDFFLWILISNLRLLRSFFIRKLDMPPPPSPLPLHCWSVLVSVQSIENTKELVSFSWYIDLPTSKLLRWETGALQDQRVVNPPPPPPAHE